MRSCWRWRRCPMMTPTPMLAVRRRQTPPAHQLLQRPMMRPQMQAVLGRLQSPCLTRRRASLAHRLQLQMHPAATASSQMEMPASCDSAPQQSLSLAGTCAGLWRH